MWQFPQCKYFPHDHPEGPHIRFCGEFILQDSFRGHPTKWNPGLVIVIIFAEHGEKQRINQLCPNLLNMAFGASAKRDRSNLTCCKHLCWDLVLPPSPAFAHWPGSSEMPSLCEQTCYWRDVPFPVPLGSRTITEKYQIHKGIVSILCEAKCSLNWPGGGRIKGRHFLFCKIS